MNELKKLYLYVKSRSGEFKKPLGESFTGDELFSVITQYNSLNLSEVAPEDTKLSNKLFHYLQMNPVQVNVIESVGGYRSVEFLMKATE